MRCETSFFSLTLYKKHLKRNWPLWAVWLLLWLMVFPLQIWNHNVWGSNVDKFVRDLPMGCITVLVPILAFTAALVAVTTFFHLFKSPAANFIGALPLRREGVFLTAFAAGYTMLMGPLVVVTVVTILLEGIIGYLAPEIFIFLGAAALQSFFWLSFAVLCCVISGHGVAAVAFYAIFNFIVPVMVELVEGLLTGFLYGFVGFSDKVYEASQWLCPVYKLTSHVWDTPMYFDDWNLLAIYAGVGFLMALLAVGLHHIRKAERSGDLIAFDPVKWIFKICVTVCGGLAFGTLFTLIIFGASDLPDGWKFGVCCAVAAFLSYMVAEMLLTKSFKVWKRKGSWQGALISAVAFILLVAAVDMDWIGFTTRVPDPASVKTVTATFDGTGMSSAANNLLFTGEDVKAVTDLHQYLVEHRSEDYGDNDRYLRVQVEYKVGWTTLRRQYRTWYTYGDEVSRLVDDALAVGNISFPYERGTPNYLTMEVRLPAENGDDAEYIGLDISVEDIKPAWDAVTADVRARRYTLRTLSNEEDGTNTGTLFAQWYNERDTGGRTTYYELRLSPELTQTWQTLDDLGYLELPSHLETEAID